MLFSLQKLRKWKPHAAQPRVTRRREKKHRRRTATLPTEAPLARHLTARGATATPRARARRPWRRGAETWPNETRRYASERETAKVERRTSGLFDTCATSFSGEVATMSTLMYELQRVFDLPAIYPQSWSMYKMRSIHEDGREDRRPSVHDANSDDQAKMPDDAVLTQVISLLQVSVSFPSAFLHGRARRTACARARYRVPRERERHGDTSRKFPRAH